MIKIYLVFSLNLILLIKMKKSYFLIISSFIIYISSSSQNLVMNGSFETNTVSVNTLGLTTTWAATVAHSFEVSAGMMDLITSNSCGTASDGNWYVTCSNPGSGWPYMSFSFKLTSTLSIGAQYTLTFDKRFCGPNSSPIDIGVSTDSTVMGTAVHTFAMPSLNTWSTETYIFQAPLAAKYLTVNVGVAGGTGTVGLDNFSLTAMATGITEHSNQTISLFPNPSNGIITVSNLNKSYKSTIDIYDVLGKKVYTSIIENQQNTTIDLSKQARGIYFYRINNGEGKQETGKLVIDK